jgi:hypothetical protein
VGELKYKVSMFLGSIELKSYFKPEGDRLVGYGLAIHRDRDGNITAVIESKTGVEVTCG